MTEATEKGMKMFQMVWEADVQHVVKTFFLHRTAGGMQLGHNVAQEPRHELSCAHPQILIAVPVLVLGAPDLCTKEGGAYLCILIKSKAVLDEPPGSVHDLRSGLSLNCLSIRKSMA